MSVKSILELKNYNVKKIHFDMNTDFDFSIAKKIKITPVFNREISKIDDNTVAVSLSVIIKSDKNEKLPFHVEIQIEGVFVLKNWESAEMISLIKHNAVAILFPYLRALVTIVTANTNMMPYIMPIMNIADSFD